MNLVIALLGTRQYVTAARIRATVPGYEPDDGSDRADEAFKRMFERDKAELREMGVPLETGRTSVFDTEDGYRIARADYELPEITLTGEEAAAVGLALRLWQSAQLAGAAESALVKLRAAGVEVDLSRALSTTLRTAGDPDRHATIVTAFAGKGGCGKSVVVTNLAAHICKDAGEGGIASTVELAGAICALYASIPVIQAVLILIEELL